MLAVEPSLQCYCLEDYLALFNLDESILKHSILDCHAGVSSFNAELSLYDTRVVSIDSLYAETSTTIQDAIESLIQDENKVVKMFLQDFNNGFKYKRYQAETLPFLSFADNTFDIALCANLLSTTVQDHSVTYYIAALLELCRVAKEVRVLSFNGFPKLQSSEYHRIFQMLESEGIVIDKQPVYCKIDNTRHILITARAL